MDKRKYVLCAIAATLVVSGCSAEDAASGVDPNATTWGTGDARAPLGVEGKPLAILPTGLAIADELLVRFVPGLPEDEVATALRDVDGLVTFVGPRTGYRVVRFSGLPAMLAARAALARDPRVVEAVPNHVIAGNGPETTPSYDIGILQWNLYGLTLDPFANRKEASGVTIAVLDSGAAYEDFADAKGTYRLAPDLSDVEFAAGYDFINDDAHPNDDQRHGTHVTGVIAASSGIASVAPGATVMPIKVLDSGNTGTELALAEGIVFAADQGADVINMSLTFPLSYFPSRLMQTAVDHAAQAGTIMVAAAGNHGQALVAYPAAFRDVIAVGGSELEDGFSTSGEYPWGGTIDVLERTDYSNHSFKLDVLAPSGNMADDTNGDGQPEAILAQTFAPGDPTSFGYYFYAGTSQATAEVTGLTAVMLAENEGIGAYQARALLTETAKRLDADVLSANSGRGLAHGRSAITAAKGPHALDDRPRYVSGVTVTLHDVGGAIVARAVVEVLDEDYHPAQVRVYGMFSGAAFEPVSGVTDASGLATFESPPLEGAPVVAFQVDAVTAGRGRGARVIFDRPRGFVRIDSDSLALLSQFGKGLSTTPSGPETTPSAPETTPSGAGTSGAGPETTPSYDLPTDPALTPITIAFDPALYAGTDYRRTVELTNFSWGLATVPMAVAADEDWFLATFPNAASRRVISFGKGFGGSALYFDLTSFPTLLAWEPTPFRVPLILLTFTSGLDLIAAGPETTPSSVFVDPAYLAARSGDETSHLTMVETLYGEFSPLVVASPVASYADALNAAGVSLAP